MLKSCQKDLHAADANIKISNARILSAIFLVFATYRCNQSQLPIWDLELKDK